MAVSKKADVGEPVKPLPKFGEVGYKFLVEAEITEVDFNEIYPYEVRASLEDGSGSGECAYLRYDKEELVTFITKTNPKFKKDYITQQLKDAKALVASLEKQLAAN